jgi:hypothetical protein
MVVRRDSGLNDGAASSGSEGFCEPEVNRHNSRDSDSSLENAKGFHSRSNSLDEPEMSPPLGDGERVKDAQHRVLIPGSQDFVAEGGEVFEEVYNREGGDGVQVASLQLKTRPNNKTAAAPIGVFQDAACSVKAISSALASSSDLSAKDSSQAKLTGAAAVAPSAGATGAAVDPSSEQSSDEYQMYFYDTKAKVGDLDKRKKEKSDEPNLFSGLKKMENVQEV